MKRSYPSALLTIMAVLFAFGLQSAHLPAAWLFGPLVASALFAVRDWQAVEWPGPVYIAAQAVIGTALDAFLVLFRAATSPDTTPEIIRVAFGWTAVIVVLTDLVWYTWLVWGLRSATRESLDGA